MLKITISRTNKKTHTEELQENAGLVLVTHEATVTTQMDDKSAAMLSDVIETVGLDAFAEGFRMMAEDMFQKLIMASVFARMMTDGEEL